jgi:hypothetical protein
LIYFCVAIGLQGFLGPLEPILDVFILTEVVIESLKTEINVDALQITSCTNVLIVSTGMSENIKN